MEKGMNTAHILEDVGVYTHSYGSVSREQGKWQFRVQHNSMQLHTGSLLLIYSQSQYGHTQQQKCIYKTVQLHC